MWRERLRFSLRTARGKRLTEAVAALIIQAAKSLSAKTAVA
jgi:hypothetical protein